MGRVRLFNGQTRFQVGSNWGRRQQRQPQSYSNPFAATPARQPNVSQPQPQRQNGGYDPARANFEASQGLARSRQNTEQPQTQDSNAVAANSSAEEVNSPQGIESPQDAPAENTSSQDEAASPTGETDMESSNASDSEPATSEVPQQAEAPVEASTSEDSPSAADSVESPQENTAAPSSPADSELTPEAGGEPVSETPQSEPAETPESPPQENIVEPSSSADPESTPEAGSESVSETPQSEPAETPESPSNDAPEAPQESSEQDTPQSGEANGPTEAAPQSSPSEGESTPRAESSEKTENASAAEKKPRMSMEDQLPNDAEMGALNTVRDLLAPDKLGGSDGRFNHQDIGAISNSVAENMLKDPKGIDRIMGERDTQEKIRKSIDYNSALQSARNHPNAQFNNRGKPRRGPGRAIAQNRVAPRQAQEAVNIARNPKAYYNHARTSRGTESVRSAAERTARQRLSTPGSRERMEAQQEVAKRAAQDLTQALNQAGMNPNSGSAPDNTRRNVSEGDLNRLQDALKTLQAYSERTGRQMDISEGLALKDIERAIQLAEFGRNLSTLADKFRKK